MVNIYDLVQAVSTTLAAATEVERATANETLTDGINDPKMLQVYPEEGNGDAATRNQQTTFGGGVIQERIVIFADYYCKQSVSLGEDMAKLTRGVDSIRAALRAETTRPLFGLSEAVQSFKWSWQRTIFVYGAPEQKFAAARFTLEFRVT